jgi:hypothetical protein
MKVFSQVFCLFVCFELAFLVKILDFFLKTRRLWNLRFDSLFGEIIEIDVFF